MKNAKRPIFLQIREKLAFGGLIKASGGKIFSYLEKNGGCGGGIFSK